MFNFKFSAPLAATLALVLILIFAGLRYPGFLGSYNILTVLQYNSMFCLISIGMCFVIMTGGIDLSKVNIIEDDWDKVSFETLQSRILQQQQHQLIS